MKESLEFIFSGHLSLATLSALLFAAGIMLSIPVIRMNTGWIKAFPLWVFRKALRLLGDQPTIFRMTLVIFLFNGTAMFVYLSTGLVPLIPMIIALLTGFNVAVIFSSAGELADQTEAGRPSSSQWIPGPAVTIVCTILVLALELPCFWYSIAMGISMGQELLAGGNSYADLLAVRGRVYGGVIVPILLVSAISEAIAVRGAGALSEKKARIR